MPSLRAYLDGTPVGTFTLSDAGQVTFTYDASYRQGVDPTPLSLSMRPSRRTWPAKAARPFLAGLLSDNPEHLQDIATRFHTSTQPFQLLQNVGLDAAGAVQLLPEGDGSTDAAVRTGDIRRLSDGEFAELMTGIATSSGPLSLRDFGGRWSLAGAQAKTALYRFDDGDWGVPQDSTPTTYILKPSVAALPQHHVNEFVTMAAARQLGLSVADHELLRTSSGVNVFATARYDRRDGHRLHQEDFCQAMSVDPVHKYQEDKGPSILQMVQFLRNAVSHSADLRLILDGLFEALLFNFAVENTDAHAKNYSLLLEGSSVRLAPLYDLGSHLSYGRQGDRPTRSAMAIDGDYVFDSIGQPHFVKIAGRFGIPADDAAERYRRVTSGVAEAFDSAAATVDDPYARVVADAVAAHATRRGWLG